MSRWYAAFALLGLAGTAAAASVTYTFTGSVVHDEAERGWAAFSGSFSYDDATADAIANGQTGAYAHAGAPWAFMLAFDGGPAHVFDGSLHLLVSNDLGGFDALGVLASAGPSTVSLELLDFGAGVFGTDALPAAPLALASFGWSSLRFEDGAATLNGRLDSLTCAAGCGVVEPPPLPVPEPGSAALAGLGLAVLGARRRTAPALVRCLAAVVTAGAAGAALPVHATPAVARDGAGWVIDAQKLPRDALALQLAQASGSTLHGSFGGALPPVTLRWRGASLAEAWEQVLGGRVNHARRCGAARCEVWLAGPVGAAPATAAPVLPAQLQPDPPGLFPAE